MQTAKTGFSVTKSLAMNSAKNGAIIGTKGFLLGKIIRFDNDKLITLGRDASQCDVVLKGDKISRVHCSIRYNSKTKDYSVQDHSKNGTFVDGKYRLQKGTLVNVKVGSLIWIGNDENEIRLG